MAAVTDDMQLAPMDPGDDVPYQVDFAGVIADASDTSISAHDITLPLSGTVKGLTLGTHTAAGTVVEFWLSIDPGSPYDATWWDGNGQLFPIIISVTTSGGKTLERTVRIRVKQL